MALPSGFCVNIARQPLFFDTLTKLLDDEARIRSLAVAARACATQASWGSDGVPTLADSAWQTLLDRLKKPLRSKDMAVRREAVDMLTAMFGGAMPTASNNLNRPGLDISVPESLADRRNKEVISLLATALDGSDAPTCLATALAIVEVGLVRPRDPEPLLAAWEAVRDTVIAPIVLSEFAFELERVAGDGRDPQAVSRTWRSLRPMPWWKLPLDGCSSTPYSEGISFSFHVPSCPTN